ncbi:hypothetical protein EV196_102160 [Mariniflexile fucanivorans]|uniref:Uncharacterized protein n=1 Tax=Mariniflexile fucanivorans TaxID=264023 RepID=A0A4R1RP06_9FLAO|nr:hypothetical protein [Mariniflexile fucanivorans]TCL67602.1 hypothetical protein EV196_102160 [Mariniflexile fucanivorans]
MSSIEKINDQATQKAFNKKVVATSQQLHPYVKQRLYIAESTGVIPKKMYASNGIIDESIASFYEKGYDIDMEVNAIKLKLFKYADAELDAIFRKEDFHKNTVSTNSILEEEMEALKEKYTIDDGFDFVMNDELNDISYQQDQKQKHLFLYDEADNSFLSTFESEDLSENKSKEIIGSLYGWLPLNVSSIIDLLVFGKLNFEEIAKVKSIEVKRVEFIYEEVKNKFKDHLD